MKRLNNSLLIAALALGTAASLSTTPVEARPVMVERLAELNVRGTAKDHGGLAFSSRTLPDTDQRPAGILSASSDGFSLAVDKESIDRLEVVERTIELNARGTEKASRGLALTLSTF
ncbi:MAG: hypothetical protein AAF704_16195 [Cyanobacteria bacterium P01_D01_bin.123]